MERQLEADAATLDLTLLPLLALEPLRMAIRNLGTIATAKPLYGTSIAYFRTTFSNGRAL